MGVPPAVVEGCAVGAAEREARIDAVALLERLPRGVPVPVRVVEGLPEGVVEDEAPPPPRA